MRDAKCSLHRNFIALCDP